MSATGGLIIDMQILSQVPFYSHLDSNQKLCGMFTFKFRYFHEKLSNVCLYIFPTFFYKNVSAKDNFQQIIDGVVDGNVWLVNAEKIMCNKI